jgi:hypothetical protein
MTCFQAQKTGRILGVEIPRQAAPKSKFLVLEIARSRSPDARAVRDVR